MRRVSRVAVALICILLVAVVFAPVPGGLVWLSRLHDFAHGPIFGCVAVLALIAFRRKVSFATLPAAAQYAIALAAAVGLGFLTELAQIPVGRDASWLDARNDVLGALAFLALFTLFDPQIREQASVWKKAAALMLGAASLGYIAQPLILVAGQYYERHKAFPVIADFTGESDPDFIWRTRVLLKSTPLPAALSASQAERAGRVRFLPQEYAGVNFHEPWPDWRNFSTLAIEAANPTEQTLALVVRVHDVHHNNEFEDRFNKRVTLPANTREVFRFPLADIKQAPQGRLMDLQRIAGVVVFRAEVSSADEMYLVKVWLEE